MVVLWLQILVMAAAIDPALSGCETESPSVGTTLFRVQDLDRRCWTAEQLDLLRYRHAFQDLVPVDPPKVTAEYATAFIEYVHACLEEAGAAESETAGNASGYPRKLLLTLAAADALGGFLHARLLPRARRAFYKGCIGFSDVSALHELLVTLRRLLHTDGGHWRPPDATPATSDSPQPLQLTTPTPPAHAPPSTAAPARRRRQPCAWHACPGLVTYPRTDGAARGSFVIPLPFLDDRYEPASMALPLRPVSLYKLDAPYATGVLAKYYVMAIKCLHSNKAPDEEVKAFNEHLYARLVTDMVPRLADDRLYAAFGAVQRVLETLVQAGVGEKRGGEYVLPAHLSALAKPTSFDIDYYRPRVEEPPSDENASGLVSEFDVLRGAPAAGPPAPLAQDVVVLSVMTASLLWLGATMLLLLCWCCSSCCRRHADPRAGFFYNVFVSIFYTLKNSLSPKPSAEIRPEPSNQQQVPPLATLPDMEPSSVASFRSPPLSLPHQPPTSVTVSLSHAPPPTRTESSLRTSMGRATVTTTATTTSTTSEDDYSDSAESEGQHTR